MTTIEVSNISDALFASLDTKITEINDNLKSALLSAAITMKETAIDKFINNQYGYKVSRLKDAIIVGKVSVLPGGIARVHLSGLGPKVDTTPQMDLYKARFFIGGTVERKSRGNSKKNQESNRGSIRAIDCIRQSLNEQILIERINNALNQK